jgi:hypothetical protein
MARKALTRTLPLLAALTIGAAPLMLANPAFAQGAPRSLQFWWPEQRRAWTTVSSPIARAR